MRGLASLVAGLTMASGVLHAQVVETPIPFDSAHRVLAVTPSVAERFHLAAPTWPVRDEYREARLFAIDPGGGFVLVVQRPTGALERWMFTADQRAALQASVDAGMAAVGRPTADIAVDVVSEPAGNAFARHQTLLGAAIYGPVAASLTDQGSGAAALYLIVTGASFFASYGAAQSNSFTRAQSDLAGNLGLAAGGAGALLGYAATGNGDRGVRAVALGSALVGTIAGVELGRRLSDAEAHAATLGIEASAALALSVTNMAGASSRASATSIAIAGLAGYPLGVRYPRHASYTVTAGDVDATSTSALVGVLVGASALGAIDNATDKQIAAYLGTGYLGGLLIGDLLLARPYDLTGSQANIIGVGAFAGALVGGAVPALASSDNKTFIFGAAAAGAVLGIGGLAASFPPTASARRRSSALPSARREGGARLSFEPASLAAAFGGIRGNHVLARLTF